MTPFQKIILNVEARQKNVFRVSANLLISAKMLTVLLARLVQMEFALLSSITAKVIQIAHKITIVAVSTFVNPSLTAVSM